MHNGLFWLLRITWIYIFIAAQFCFALGDIFEKMFNVQMAHKNMYGGKHSCVTVMKRRPFATRGNIYSNTHIDSIKIDYYQGK